MYIPLRVLSPRRELSSKAVRRRCQPALRGQGDFLGFYEMAWQQGGWASILFSCCSLIHMKNRISFLSAFLVAFSFSFISLFFFLRGWLIGYCSIIKPRLNNPPFGKRKGLADYQNRGIHVSFSLMSQMRCKVGDHQFLDSFLNTHYSGSVSRCSILRSSLFWCLCLGGLAFCCVVRIITYLVL